MNQERRAGHSKLIYDKASRTIVPVASDSRWQDISTAPKDGTPILIFEVRASFRSFYMPEGALKPGENTYRTDDPRLLRYDDARFAIGYWCPWGGWGNRNYTHINPTHWLPLPAPPSSSPVPVSDISAPSTNPTS